MKCTSNVYTNVAMYHYLDNKLRKRALLKSSARPVSMQNQNTNTTTVTDTVKY